MGLLETIDSPADLRKLSPQELEPLAQELRDTILETVSHNGGHLSSSLGTVELTIALHRVFDTPRDSIIWDVGHQAYAHKLLTGRRELFRTLRQLDGCAGFQSRRECLPYDVFGGGHAGTAISAALGLETAAMKRFGVDHPRTVAVVGDGSLNCGISLEGLNNISESGTPLVVILNDNKMSISGNVGALPDYLNRVIANRYYSHFRNLSKKLLGRVPALYRGVQRIEEKVKSLLLPAGVFEEFGLRYLGPVNGHSLPDLTRTLALARDAHCPVLVHVVTGKGHGYAPAERNPEAYHGVGPFDPAVGLPKCDKMSFSKAFGLTMMELARQRRDVVAITAAMSSGTGLAEFAREFPERFFDVGIAEEHALVFAGGLAAGGMRPAAAIYSTFMQRAFDPIYHDICLQNLPVVMALDRCGAVEDGPTHHGIYDLAFLRAMPNLTIWAPMDETELRAMLHAAMSLDGPSAIRYPRGGSGQPFDAAGPVEPITPGKARLLRAGGDLTIWAHGVECHRALRVAELLAKDYQLNAAVIQARTIKPLDAETARNRASQAPVFVMEDHALCGGLGDALRELVPVRGAFGWPDQVIPHGKIEAVRRKFYLGEDQIARAIAEAMRHSK